MAQSQPQYSIAFNEHPVHEGLGQLKEQVGDLSETLLGLAREHDPQASLARLEPALDYVSALLASADPALVTPQMLDGLATSIQQISSALTLFKENEEWAQIPSVQAGVDGLLNMAMQIAPAIGVWAKSDARKAAALLGEASSAKARQLQGQASELGQQLNQLREQATQSEISLKTASDERLKELEGQLDILKTEAEAERARVKHAVDSFVTQFKSEQEMRDTQFAESTKALQDQTEQVIQESREAAAKSIGTEEERADKLISDLHKRSSEVVNFLAEKKQEAIDMVDAEATSSTAGAFKKEAEDQKDQADLWRLLTLSLGGLAVLVALVAVGLVVGEFAEGSSFILAKIAAITLLLGLAGYAAGQSGQHRRREKRARRLYLELVAFKPFSEPLPEPERHSVRKEFIERLFVGDPGAEGEDHKEDEVKLSDENLSVLLKFMDMVRSSR
jgi:hypothetical protein